MLLKKIILHARQNVLKSLQCKDIKNNWKKQKNAVKFQVHFLKRYILAQYFL